MLHHNSLEIHQREKEGIVILDLHGKLVMGSGDIALGEFVRALYDADNRQLILNLAGVPEIDTSGMGVLLIRAEEYRDGGGKMVLYNIAHSHGKIYEMARLEAVIEIYRDELDAVNSFFPDRKTSRYDILDYIESHSHPEPPPAEKSK
jgi:anti-sigma B factor antagonist